MPPKVPTVEGSVVGVEGLSETEKLGYRQPNLHLLFEVPVGNSIAMSKGDTEGVFAVGTEGNTGDVATAKEFDVEGDLLPAS